MLVCFLIRKSKKVYGFEGGRSGMSWKRGNFNQNMKKNLFSIFFPVPPHSGPPLTFLSILDFPNVIPTDNPSMPTYIYLHPQSLMGGLTRTGNALSY